MTPLLAILSMSEIVSCSALLALFKSLPAIAVRTPRSALRRRERYWRFLSRVSLGVLRVLYTENAREIAVFTRPFVLLRFQKPEYEIGDDAQNFIVGIRFTF